MAISRNVYSLVLTVMLAMAVKGMFFTDSKENDYPRIGKRCRTSSKFYNSIFCRNSKTDGYPEGSSIRDKQNLLSPLNSIYSNLHQDVAELESAEDIFAPSEVIPDRQRLSSELLERVRQYLRTASSEFESL